MRIETINGRHVLCGHILHTDFLLAGQTWAPADGSNREVKIERIDRGWVHYYWEEDDQRREHEKQAFDFQCRYCLVIDYDTHEENNDD